MKIKNILFVVPYGNIAMENGKCFFIKELYHVNLKLKINYIKTKDGIIDCSKESLRYLKRMVDKDAN